MLAFTDLIETKTLIKFGVIFIPLAVYIIVFTNNTLKWKALLTLGSFIGTAIALAGKTIGKDHGFGGGR